MPRAIRGWMSQSTTARRVACGSSVWSRTATFICASDVAGLRHEYAIAWLFAAQAVYILLAADGITIPHKLQDLRKREGYADVSHRGGGIGGARPRAHGTCPGQ